MCRDRCQPLWLALASGKCDEFPVSQLLPYVSPLLVAFVAVYSVWHSERRLRSWFHGQPLVGKGKQESSKSSRHFIYSGRKHCMLLICYERGKQEKTPACSCGPVLVIQTREHKNPQFLVAWICS